ncbi:hypothetical protein A7R81_32030 [Pseudomonas aeruginosa]|nr:hypothetical protein A7R81_32030 [Pseudomonas aeruginosa]
MRQQSFYRQWFEDVVGRQQRQVEQYFFQAGRLVHEQHMLCRAEPGDSGETGQYDQPVLGKELEKTIGIETADWRSGVADEAAIAALHQITAGEVEDDDRDYSWIEVEVAAGGM